MDDCLRCHGMHFEGGIRDLVVPLNTKGPWRLSSPELADQPVVPCLSCHQLHQVGAPHVNAKIGSPTPGREQETNRPSLGLFDRRELTQVPVDELPLPKMLEGTRAVESVRTSAKRFATSATRRGQRGRCIREITARRSVCMKDLAAWRAT